MTYQRRKRRRHGSGKTGGISGRPQGRRLLPHWAREEEEPLAKGGTHSQRQRWASPVLRAYTRKAPASYDILTEEEESECHLLKGQTQEFIQKTVRSLEQQREHCGGSGIGS